MNPEELMGRSKNVLQYLTGVLGVFLLVLFTLGVFDVGLQIYRLIVTGGYGSPSNIVALLDVVLLLLIVLEVFRDLDSYVKGKNLVPVIIEIGIIAVVRKIITTTASESMEGLQGFYFAASSLVLLLGLFAGYYVLERYGDISEEA